MNPEIKDLIEISRYYGKNRNMRLPEEGILPIKTNFHMDKSKRG